MLAFAMDKFLRALPERRNGERPNGFHRLVLRVRGQKGFRKFLDPQVKVRLRRSASLDSVDPLVAAFIVLRMSVSSCLALNFCFIQPVLSKAFGCQ